MTHHSTLLAILAVTLIVICNAQVPSECGTEESEYAPCVAKDAADELFQSCCRQFVPNGCLHMCTYETRELPARDLLLDIVKSNKCDLRHLSAVLYCASQNQDNRQCCQYLNMADPKLGVGNSCLRMCDPRGEGITKITKEDVNCLFNWNVIMYCAHSGLRVD